jgi:hypothetical protein
MAYKRRRHARRNPEYKGWKRVMQKKSTGDFFEMASYGVLAYVGYKVYQWLTEPKTSP